MVLVHGSRSSCWSLRPPFFVTGAAEPGGETAGEDAVHWAGTFTQSQALFTVPWRVRDSDWCCHLEPQLELQGGGGVSCGDLGGMRLQTVQESKS